jgi:hypothetical protein
MDVELSTNIPQSLPEERQGLKRLEVPVLAYWGISAILGVLFLRDWIMQWNVWETLSRPWLVIWLILTLVIGQVIYSLVAHHDHRPIRWGATAIFSIGNGIFETFAFALVYRLGEFLGIAAGNLLFPSAAGWIGFILGAIFFIIYGGSIHALFWLRILPPHLKDTSLARTIRRYRMINEIALVLGWCLCLWLSDDIWTVVFFHMLVDLGLMVRVRPNLFINGNTARAQAKQVGQGETQDVSG